MFSFLVFDCILLLEILKILFIDIIDNGFDQDVKLLFVGFKLRLIIMVFIIGYSNYLNLLMSFR